MASNAPQPLYTIIDMRPEVVRQPDGSYTPAYRVDFRVGTGHASHVIVPRSPQLEEDVHRAVEAEAQLIANTVQRPVIPTTQPRNG